MITVIKTTDMNFCGGLQKLKFEFEFDDGSSLPINTYQLGLTTYVISNGSTAKNIKDNTYYEYNDGEWVKTLGNVTPSTSTNTITENGNYTVAANEYTGMGNVEVKVESEEVSDNFTMMFGSWYNDVYSRASAFITPINGEVTIDLGDIGMDGYTSGGNYMAYICITAPLRKLTIGQYQTRIYFIPTDDFDGFYYLGGNAYTLDGDEVVKDGNTVFEAEFNSSPFVTIHKCVKSYVE